MYILKIDIEWYLVEGLGAIFLLKLADMPHSLWIMSEQQLEEQDDD